MQRGLLLVGLAACLAPDESVPPPIDVVSCQAGPRWAQPSEPMPELDLVIAVGDVDPDALAAGLDQLATYLVDRRFSLHVAILASGPGDAGDYLVDLDVPWFLCPDQDCRTRNYDGALADALMARAVPSSGPAPLLARIDHALANDRGFVAPDGYLGVLVISASDDASDEGALVYADRIRARVPEGHAQFSGAIRAGGRRLAAFLETERDPAVAALDDPDWSPAFGWEFWHVPIPAACLVDEDPDQCTAMDGDTPVPRCLMAAPDRPDPATPLPCFWIRSGFSACASAGGLEPIIERPRWHPVSEYFDTTITCACR